MTPPRPHKSLARFLKAFGPGVVAGAADDDPSGVATYSVAGAQWGTSFLWTALLTWPLMAAVQLMCARIGMVTGRGLAGALRRKFSRRVLMVAAGALLVAYIVAGLVIRPDWSRVIHDTFVPTWPVSPRGWSTLVALLGTTISPYLFFWQASQEVEEERAMGRRLRVARLGATAGELADRRLDVGVGTLASNVVMYFIILTTAMTLHRAGRTEIETSRQAAEALRPLAGELAYLLYTVGILGVGFLAIPTLTGSAAYALAETFAWRQGLDKNFRQARPFYLVVVFSTLAGVLLEFVGVSPITALYWAAVLNGLLSPFLLTGIVLVAADRKIMQGQPSSPLSLCIVAVGTLVMFAAGLAMFVL